MRRIHILMFILASALLGLTSSAYADGVHIPPLVYQVPATIPQQRALISFRDGRETLIIESSFQSEAKEVGWIIPLPVVPDNIQPVSAGAMKTIAFRLQPAIIHETPTPLVLLCIITSIVAVITLYLRFKPKDPFWPQTPFEVIVLLFVLLVLAGMFLPALASAGHSVAQTPTSANIAIAKQAHVGNYDVTILRANEAADLNQWLSDNGFMSVPEKGLPIAKDYIAKGWCFAAARLQRTESGLSTPHPIRFDFAATEAVYPMRLTALSGAPVELELYVVGDRIAACSGLKMDFCDAYDSRAVNVTVERNGRPHDHRTQTEFIGHSFAQNIAHPDLTTLMWNGCVVTKLAGHVAPDQMKEDFRVTWKRGLHYRHLYFSRRGLHATILTCIVLLGTVALIVLPAIGERIMPRRGKWWFFSRVVCPCVAGILVGAVIAEVLLPTTEVAMRHHWEDWVGEDIARALESRIHDKHLSATASKAEVEQAARAFVSEDDYLGADGRNACIGGPIFQEISPGNYDIREENGVLYVVQYDRFCRERWYEVSTKAP